MDEDDAQGATDEWVALLAFSQGTRMAVSRRGIGCKQGMSVFRFAVILAGCAPLLTLDPELIMSSAPPDASHSVLGFTDFPDGDDPETQAHSCRSRQSMLMGNRTRVVHTHKRLLEQYREHGSTRRFEWDGDHRLPVKAKDVVAVVEQIPDIEEEKGVFEEPWFVEKSRVTFD